MGFVGLHLISYVVLEGVPLVPINQADDNLLPSLSLSSEPLRTAAKDGH